MRFSTQPRQSEIRQSVKALTCFSRGLKQALSRLAPVVWIVSVASITVALTFCTSTSLAAVQAGNFATVSAANYQAPVTPESLVAGFGPNLATTTESATKIPLPTTLALRTVEVRDSAGTIRLASLLFVAPEQINYQIPAGTSIGIATVSVKAGNNIIANGTVEVAAVSPAIFTANTYGFGLPAAQLFRLKADGTVIFPELLLRPDSTEIPVNLGPDGEKVFLILYATGIRSKTDANDVRVVIGGKAFTPAAVIAVPGLVGLDQLNVELSRELIGRGNVDLTIAGTGFKTSNVCKITIASPIATAPPVVSSFSTGVALAGQALDINGSSFATTAANNLVRIGGIEAKVTAATPTRLTVQVPFGAVSGKITVKTDNGEGESAGALSMRTSVSGFVQDAASLQPLKGATVTLRNSDTRAGIKSITTLDNGTFILPDVPEGDFLLEADGTTVPTSPPYAKDQPKMKVIAGRDNQFQRPIALQQGTGSPVSVGSTGSPSSRPDNASASPADYVKQLAAQTGDPVFEVPANAKVRFPDGTTSGNLVTTLVEKSRVSTDLPGGYFSSAIVQITPFGVTLSPGGKLTFPNPDNLRASTLATLFRFDQTPGSSTLGTWVSAGTAIVSADGQKIETATNAITETSYYFVSIQQQTTTVVGRVVANDKLTPVRQAIVQARARGSFTDGNGGFIPREVAVKQGDQIPVEASVQRSSGRIDHAFISVPAVVSGISTVPDLILPPENINLPPVLITPLSLSIDAGKTGNYNFVAYDPDSSQPIQVSAALSALPGAHQGADFASYTNVGNGAYVLSLKPGINDIGDYSLVLTATDSGGSPTTKNITITVNKTVQVTVGTSPSGLFFSVDKIRYNTTQTFDWVVGSSHLLSTESPQNGGALNWTSWSDNREFEHSVITANTATSYTASFEGIPPPPTLTVSPTCDTTSPSGPAVQLNWTASSGAASFDVYRNGARVAQGIAGNSYFDKTGLTVGQTYKYYVQAVNSSGTRDSNSIDVTIQSGICNSSPVTVSLPTVTGKAGSNVTIPLTVGDLSGRGGSTGVIAFEFDLAFDPGVLQFQSPATDVIGTLSIPPLTIVTNESVPGRLRVAGYGPDGLSGVNRTLLNLKFKVVGTVGASTALTWQNLKFQFNEGDPPVSLTNGRLTVN